MSDQTKTTSDQPTITTDDLLRCPACGSTEFHLLRDRTIICAADGCESTRTQLNHRPARLADTADTWYFTFGIEHPLHGQYIRLHGSSEDTRALIGTIFGSNWAGQYGCERGQAVITEHGYRELDLGLG